MSDQQILFLQITAPKTRRRGARIQYATVESPEIIAILVKAWQLLPPDAKLYPLSPGAFRSRWNAVMKRIGIPSSAKLTPGSLRPGGAIALHKSGTSISTLLWRMRLQHQQTLAFYLQEMTAASVLPSLDEPTRQRIKVLQEAMPLFVEQ
eukprot:Skav207213  [mRNA]  locus=scaffold1244:117168:117617:+ [translate_table: standard]